MAFANTSTTFSHDDAGNLVDNGPFVYTYDAWHRLVKVQASEDNQAVTLGEGWMAARREAKQDYQRVIEEHARQGWRLVQVFAPGIGANATAAPQGPASVLPPRTTSERVAGRGAPFLALQRDSVGGRRGAEAHPGVGSCR